MGNCVFYTCNYEGSTRQVLYCPKITEKQGNSVTRDLPPTGSEANTTIFVLYILDIDSHCPYLLSGETTLKSERSDVRDTCGEGTPVMRGHL